MPKAKADMSEPATDAELNEAVDRFLTPRPLAQKLRDDGLLGRGAAIALDCGLAATAWGDGPTVLLAHGFGRAGGRTGARLSVRWPKPAFGRRRRCPGPWRFAG